MFSGMREQRSVECASDLRFDAWLAGELSTPAQTELVMHVASCARCSERQQRIVQARERFDTSLDAVISARPANAAPRERSAELTLRLGRRSVTAGVCVALAAAAMFALLPKREPAGDRVKGGEHVSFFVKRGDTVQRGAHKQRVQPGDKLRFAYTAMAPRYLAILSVDVASTVSVYYPASDRAARVPPGVEMALPSAVELDACSGGACVCAVLRDAARAGSSARAAAPHAARAEGAAAMHAR